MLHLPAINAVVCLTCSTSYVPVARMKTVGTKQYVANFQAFQLVFQCTFLTSRWNQTFKCVVNFSRHITF